MSALTTVVGNIVYDIELKHTNAGKAFASVTIAVNERRKDPRTGEMVDGEAWFARGTVWEEFAENVAATLSKGTRVVGYAKIKQRSYDDKDNQRRTTIELEFEALGPDLRWATANVARRERHGGVGAPTAPVAGDWLPTPQNVAQNGFGDPGGFNNWPETQAFQ